MVFRMENLSNLMNVNSTRRNVPEIQKLSKKTELFLTTMYCLAAAQYLICFLANALTIASVVKFDYLHKKSSNLLILSLSIADGLLGELFFFFSPVPSMRAHGHERVNHANIVSAQCSPK